MIRFILLYAFMTLHTIIFCFWCVIIAVFDGSGRLVHFYGAVPWAKVILWVCGVKVDVGGRDYIDGRVPRIYMSNHQSYFDIFILLGHLPANFKFILKEELMKIPLLGFAMKRARYIAIDRGDPRKALKSMNEAARKIRNGASVLIFPEGTRSEDGRLQPFKRGGFRLALKSGCEIVPVGIIKSRDIVPKGSLNIKKGRIGMNIGKPIPVKDYSKRETDQLITHVREDMIRLMGSGDENA